MDRATSGPIPTIPDLTWPIYDALSEWAAQVEQRGWDSIRETFADTPRRRKDDGYEASSSGQL